MTTKPKVTLKKQTCPSCGSSFTDWREKLYCSEPCRKKAENARYKAKKLSADIFSIAAKELSIPPSKEAKRGDEATTLPGTQISPSQVIDFKGIKNRKRGYETPVFSKVNEETWKATIKGGVETVAWLMDVAGYGWFGKVKDEGTDWTYGPSSFKEAKKAVEDFLRTGDSYDWLIGSIYSGNGFLRRYSVPREAEAPHLAELMLSLM